MYLRHYQKRWLAILMVTCMVRLIIRGYFLQFSWLTSQVRKKVTHPLKYYNWLYWALNMSIYLAEIIAGGLNPTGRQDITRTVTLFLYLLQIKIVFPPQLKIDGIIFFRGFSASSDTLVTLCTGFSNSLLILSSPPQWSG